MRSRAKLSGAAIAWLVVGYVAAVVGLMLLRGAILVQVWEWFVTDTFGVTTLTLVQALGLSVVVTLLTYHVDTKPDGMSAGERLLTTTLTGLFWYGLLFLSAATIHAFA
jgi:hypothetical protein